MQRQSDNNRIIEFDYNSMQRSSPHLHYIYIWRYRDPVSYRLVSQLKWHLKSGAGRSAKQLWFSIYILLFSCSIVVQGASEKVTKLVSIGHIVRIAGERLRIVGHCQHYAYARWYTHVGCTSAPASATAAPTPHGHWGVCCQFLRIKSLTCHKLSCSRSCKSCAHLVWDSMSAIKDEIKTCFTHTHGFSWVDIWIDIFR